MKRSGQRMIVTAVVGVMLGSAVCALLPGCKRAGKQVELKAGPKAVSRAQTTAFDTIMGNLDSGGDLLVVANMEGAIEELVGAGAEMIQVMAGESKDAQKATAMMTKLDSFLRAEGFYAVRGFGLSIVPGDDGLNLFRTFLCRDRDAADRSLWRAMASGKQRRLKGIDYLPAETALARVWGAEPGQAWQLVRRGVESVAAPEAAQAFEAGLTSVNHLLDVSPDKLAGSLGDEGFLAVMLARDKTITIPMGKEMVAIPEPAILVGMAVKDETLFSVLSSRIQKSGLPVTKTMVGASELMTVDLSGFPVPVPMPMRPTIAQHDGYVLFGSSDTVVSDALRAAADGAGLVAEKEFKDVFAGLPFENNGVAFSSARLRKTIEDVHMASLAMNGANGRKQAEAAAKLMRMFCAAGDLPSAVVTLNAPDGIATLGRAPISARQYVGAVTMAPVGMMAAIAIPSFMKARERSRSNACINNLRQIDAAKEQAALENQWQEGADPDLEKVKLFIRGNQLPVCPAGGTYTVGLIGEDPTCTVSGHTLNFGPKRSGGRGR